MQSKKSMLAATAVLSALFLGCSDSADPTITDDFDSDATGGDYESTDDDWTESGTDHGPAPKPFSRAVEGVVENKAQWANFEVAVKAARIERGMDDVWTEDGFQNISPKTTYLEVDLQIANLTQFDESLERRSTWDVILKDGTRIEQTNELELEFGPQGSVPYTLRYELSEDVDLHGAQLELNGVERGDYAPERIPLDAPYTPDIDVVPPELQGKVLESTRPEDYRRKKFEVLSARVSRNSLTEGRAPYGKVLVDLVVNATLVDAFQNGSFSTNKDFTLTVDGKLYRPTNYFGEVVDIGESRKFSVVFSIDDTATAFSMRFNVGHDSDSDPETEWAQVDVTL